MAPLQQSVLRCMLIFAAAVCAIGASYDTNDDKKAMPLTMSETLGDVHVMALQAAAGGGQLENKAGCMHLTLKNADNMTAVVRDPMKAELGIEMIPHAAMTVALPAFAIMLANLTSTEEATPDSFQVISVHLKELVQIQADGQLTYKVEIIDTDIARGVMPTLPSQDDIDVIISSEKLPVDMINLAKQVEPGAAELALSGAPKRNVPEAFLQGTLLIDLTDPADAHPTSLRRMAEKGELAHSINKFFLNPDEVVKGQGVMTIGWMLPWSLWAWVCCPTFFVLMPWAVPLWVFCCV